MKKCHQLLQKTFVKKNANINCLVGEYLVIGNPHMKSFELKEEDIVKIKSEKGHCLGCKCDNDDFVEGINLYSNDFRLRCLPFFPINEPIYTFILHKNGVIRFKINENIPALYKLYFVYIDSTSFIDAFWNLKHGLENGCFCFGLLTHDNHIIRYNRWNEDCVLFAQYTKIHDYS